MDRLAGQGQALFKQTSQPRKLLLRQMTEALRTGGVKAKIPLIQQAVSQSQQATSQATRQTSEELASRNIGGPFASRMLAGTRLAGAQNTAQIPTRVAEGLIAQVMPFLSNTQQLGVGATAQAAGLANQLDQFNAGAQGQMIGALAKGVTGGLGGLLGGS